MTSEELFKGKDRIQYSPIFKRPIRMGEISSLNTSDFDKVSECFEKEDYQESLARLELLFQMNIAMISTFLEWGLAHVNILASENPQKAERITIEAIALWHDGLKQGDYNTELITTMTQILRKVHPDTILEYRAKEKKSLPNESTLFLMAPKESYLTLVGMIERREFSSAKDQFAKYYQQMLERHDLAGEFVSCFASVIQQNLGQDVSSRITQQSLESCQLVGGMWNLIEILDPQSLAAFLAEHVRGHFSGDKRKSAVRIEEQKDCYRLIFEPCGSGGALRQRGVKGLCVYPDASPHTWSRAGQVPSYCVHCAKNEITSMKCLGYPAWVTEFNPDPFAPCGWTIYKDPSLIPEEFFRRIGEKKDCSKFKKRLVNVE